MPIHFSDREMTRAWRSNFQAYRSAQTKTNAHRLLLFYSVECGLKAAKMKDDRINSTSACPEIIEYGHNINRLLDALNVEENLRLPTRTKMKNDRQVSVSEINQMWRYGGEALNSRGSNISMDTELENCLLKVSQWIEQKLN